MIAKHVPIQSLRKGNYAQLVRYMCDPQGKHERVGHVRITNCHSQDPDDAILEIAATQARNQRCSGETTYHLILSFRAGETPSPEVLEKIETTVCSALGYQDHQRISVVHHDTDNLHVHLAINKIHPTKLTLHSPFLAYKTLNRLCDELECRYGLERDSHEPSQASQPRRAADLEHSAGVQSLIGWIQRECLPGLLSAGSWTELHRALKSNGLSLHLRGNGLVVSSSDGTFVKASSISRNLSRAKLESRLGRFVLSDTPDDYHTAKTYWQRPMPSRVDTSPLYARFVAARRLNAQSRSIAIARARALRERRIATAKLLAKLKRKALQFSSADRLTKAVLRRQISLTLKRTIEAARQDYQQSCRAISARHRQLSWYQWLQHLALAQDPQATQVLRARCSPKVAGNQLISPMYGREALGKWDASPMYGSSESTSDPAFSPMYGAIKRRLSGDSPRHDAWVAPTGPSLPPMYGQKEPCNAASPPMYGCGESLSDPASSPMYSPKRPLGSDSITKKGTLIHRLGGGVIRDLGDRLQVRNDATPESVLMALELAVHRFGPSLSVAGSAPFRKQVLDLAVSHRIAVRFTDPSLEKQRLALLASKRKQSGKQSQGVHR